MRILGGTSKGRKLLTPKGAETRPALARVRNSLFNILGDRLIDKYVLDLFAGTGSLGLEALSRGAKSCLFVDNNQKCLEAINQNIEIMGFKSCASTVLFNGFQVVPYLMNQSLCFDMVFVSPPYRFFADSRLKHKLLTCLEEFVRYSLLAPAGLIIMEHRRRQIQATDFNLLAEIDHRSYGQTELAFLQKKAKND